MFSFLTLDNLSESLFQSEERVAYCAKIEIEKAVLG